MMLLTSDSSYVLGWHTSFEIRIAQFATSRIVWKSNGKVTFVSNRVMGFTAKLATYFDIDISLTKIVY